MLSTWTHVCWALLMKHLASLITVIVCFKGNVKSHERLGTQQKWTLNYKSIVIYELGRSCKHEVCATLK